jgi:hypothetical protein
LIGAIDADWTKLFQKPISSFSLLFFHTAALSLSLSLSHFSRSLSLCVGVGEKKKGRRKDEGGEERDVREMRGRKEKKEKGKERGRGLLHVFGRREGIRHLP